MERLINILEELKEYCLFVNNCDICPLFNKYDDHCSARELIPGQRGYPPSWDLEKFKNNIKS